MDASSCEAAMWAADTAEPPKLSSDANLERRVKFRIRPADAEGASAAGRVTW